MGKIIRYDRKGTEFEINLAIVTIMGFIISIVDTVAPLGF